MQAGSGRNVKSTAFKIVPMNASHIEACKAIVRVSNPWKRLDEGINFRAALSANRTGTRAYVCMAGNDAAGFILFIPEPVFARGGYLRAIGVAPEFRSRGIGRKLLSFAEKMTSQRALHLFLCASSFNRQAQAFYESCGYLRVGKLPGIIIPGASEYIYWKSLDSIPARTRRAKP